MDFEAAVLQIGAGPPSSMTIENKNTQIQEILSARINFVSCHVMAFPHWSNQFVCWAAIKSKIKIVGHQPSTRNKILSINHKNLP